MIGMKAIHPLRMKGLDGLYFSHVFFGFHSYLYEANATQL